MQIHSAQVVDANNTRPDSFLPPPTNKGNVKGWQRQTRFSPGFIEGIGENHKRESLTIEFSEMTPCVV